MSVELQAGLARISAAMGYAYNHLPNNDVIKIRQSMDIFLDNLLEILDPETIDLLVVKEWKKSHKPDD